MVKTANQRIIADAGFIFALINKNDPSHQKAKLASIRHENRKWITTCFVFQEIFFLLARDNVRFLLPNLFMMQKINLLHVVNFESEQLEKIENIILKYSDQNPDLADASLILLAEKIGHGDIFTVDNKDFKTYRWANKKIFSLLL